MTWRSTLFSALAVSALGAYLWAAEPESAALQSTITKSVEAFTQTFAARDAKALAALFTPQAEYIDDTGTVFHGRAAIEAEYTARFAVEPKGSLSVEVISIRPIATGVVVEEGVSTFQPEQDGAAADSHYTAIHVQQSDGSWLLASVRELSAPSMTPHERLKSLAWLLGPWREETAGSVVNSEWKWSEDGNALLSQFTTRFANEPSMTGNHRIGWDGERNQFRSWIFDSHGGFAEGYWSAAEDDIWSVSLSGVSADGQRQATTLSYQRDGGDAIVVRQQQRTRGGESLPDLSSRIVRQPPAPAARAK